MFESEDYYPAGWYKAELHAISSIEKDMDWKIHGFRYFGTLRFEKSCPLSDDNPDLQKTQIR